VQFRTASASCTRMSASYYAGLGSRPECYRCASTMPWILTSLTLAMPADHPIIYECKLSKLDRERYRDCLCHRRRSTLCGDCSPYLIGLDAVTSASIHNDTSRLLPTRWLRIHLFDPLNFKSLGHQPEHTAHLGNM
jgi:hypothetical protein